MQTVQALAFLTIRHVLQNVTFLLRPQPDIRFLPRHALGLRFHRSVHDTDWASKLAVIMASHLLAILGCPVSLSHSKLPLHRAFAIYIDMYHYALLHFSLSLLLSSVLAYSTFS